MSSEKAMWFKKGDRVISSALAIRNNIFPERVTGTVVSNSRDEKSVRVELDGQSTGLKYSADFWDMVDDSLIERTRRYFKSLEYPLPEEIAAFVQIELDRAIGGLEKASESLGDAIGEAKFGEKPMNSEKRPEGQPVLGRCKVIQTGHTGEHARTTYCDEWEPNPNESPRVTPDGTSEVEPGPVRSGRVRPTEPPPPDHAWMSFARGGMGYCLCGQFGSQSDTKPYAAWEEHARGNPNNPAKLEEPPTAALDLLDLASWLEIESEELMKQAMGREGYAKCDENLLSEGDERKAHKIAEQMAGRKLPHQSAEELRRNASIQRKIAAKCEAEAKQLSRWADTVRAEAARASQAADGCKCVCHSYPQHGQLQDALEALKWHQDELDFIKSKSEEDEHGSL